MNDKQAKRLAKALRQARDRLGMSTHRLAELAQVDQATIVRLEAGSIAAPRPDKLARIAEALGVTLADMYALAGYAVPNDLPSFTPYLRAKYRELPTGEVEKIEAFAQRLAKKHGLDLSGPKPGEDES